MENLNLRKIWEVMNTLSYRQAILAEEDDKYVQLLGYDSNYCNTSFKSFLEYYSFKIEGDNIVVFNDDKVAWEDYSNENFSSFPSALLSFSAEELNKWIETEIELQLTNQEREKIAEKERIKQQIEQLNKRLNNL